MGAPHSPRFRLQDAVFAEKVVGNICNRTRWCVPLLSGEVFFPVLHEHLEKFVREVAAWLELEQELLILEEPGVPLVGSGTGDGGHGPGGELRDGSAVGCSGHGCHRRGAWKEERGKGKERCF